MKAPKRKVIKYTFVSNNWLYLTCNLLLKLVLFITYLYVFIIICKYLCTYVIKSDANISSLNFHLSNRKTIKIK